MPQFSNYGPNMVSIFQKEHENDLDNQHALECALKYAILQYQKIVNNNENREKQHHTLRLKVKRSFQSFQACRRTYAVLP